jgi:hypothetical protein
MDRRTASIAIIFGLMILFFAGLDIFEDERKAQLGVAAAYAVLVFLVAHWGSRRVA